MSSDKIVVENLFKVYGRGAEKALHRLKQGDSKESLLKTHGWNVGVDDVSLRINEGEIFVLMGLSGSGKSTLIRLINRLLEPTAGRVFIDGRNVSAMKQRELIALRRRDMSMVFQSFALLPNRTVCENAAFGLEIAGVEASVRRRQALAVLDQVGLAAYADTYPHDLSGGMQQRVGLARALAVNPSLMLMDEAFSALDPLTRRGMQNVVLQLQAHQRRTILFVSHDIDEACRIGSRIAILNAGRVVQVGTPSEIKASPADEYVRGFFDLSESAHSQPLSAGARALPLPAWQRGPSYV